MKLLENKSAIITGATRGIGRGIAIEFAKQGANIAFTYSSSVDAANALEKELQAFGVNAKGYQSNAADFDAAQELAKNVLAEFGAIDILVNNAAINPVYSPIEAVDPAIFDKIMEINVKAPWSLSNLVLPHFKANKNGSIINIASVEALTPGFGLGIYSTSKAAILMLTKNQAKEWGPYGVKANAICPGLIKTKFSAALWTNEKMLHKLEKSIPSGRMGMPEEMVGLACLLASDAGNYMTGGVYTADGGYMIAG